MYGVVHKTDWDKFRGQDTGYFFSSVNFLKDLLSKFFSASSYKNISIFYTYYMTNTKIINFIIYPFINVLPSIYDHS